jgi:hypothetical protein
MDPATRGPVVDAGLRTSSPGVFAIGNLLHPVDTADGAALDGRHVAAAVDGWLNNHDEPQKAVRIRTEGPFKWVAPQLVSAGGGVAARGDLLFWVDEYRRLPKLRAVQDGRVLATKRTPWPAAPGRVYRAPWSLVAGADPAGGDVTVSFA